MMNVVICRLNVKMFIEIIFALRFFASSYNCLQFWKAANNVRDFGSIVGVGPKVVDLKEELTRLFTVLFLKNSYL